MNAIGRFQSLIEFPNLEALDIGGRYYWRLAWCPSTIISIDSRHSLPGTAAQPVVAAMADGAAGT